MRNSSCSSSGSSPRMRGKHLFTVARAGLGGLIPAHAGKTPPAPTAAGRERAHPRACGENLMMGARKSRIAGSSPRMRGKRSPCGNTPSTLGLIPAHAGKTHRWCDRSQSQRAHPRACGENGPSAPPGPRRPGSSPRMRGKRTPEGMRKGRLGLIPAHAGKTAHDDRLLRRGRAHPRACGENIVQAIIDALKPGSSPRMRGKPPGPARR